MLKTILLSAISFVGLNSCAQKDNSVKTKKETKTMTSTNKNLDTATFGTGCFWCTEAVFQQLKGVEKVTSGYSGGHTENPDYKEVCTGTTGHAECLNIIYEPAKVSFDDLLEIFWQVHDPTTLNRQGNDVGTQYRSVIFYHTPEQQKIAQAFKTDLNAQKVFPNPIVTEISPFTKFYKAENYHQQYIRLNGSEPYCTYVIKPKLDKFKKAFHDKLKK